MSSLEELKAKATEAKAMAHSMEQRIKDNLVENARLRGEIMGQEQIYTLAQEEICILRHGAHKLQEDDTDSCDGEVERCENCPFKQPLAAE